MRLQSSTRCVTMSREDIKMNTLTNLESFLANAHSLGISVKTLEVTKIVYANLVKDLGSRASYCEVSDSPKSKAREAIIVKGPVDRVYVVSDRDYQYNNG